MGQIERLLSENMHQEETAGIAEELLGKAMRAEEGRGLLWGIRPFLVL